MTGLELLSDAGRLLGLAFGTAALSFVLMHLKGRGAPPFLTALWQDVAAADWRSVPGCATKRGLSWLDGAVSRYFSRADEGAAYGLLFMLVIFLLIPAAAVFNLVTGGSPFLAYYYLAALLVLALLNFTAESAKFSWFNRLASLYLGLSAFVLIPVYVLRSFSERILSGFLATIVLEAIVVSSFVYVVAHSLMLAWDTLGGSRHPAATRAVHTGLAVAPATYVLVFAAMQLGSFAVPDAPFDRSWVLMVAGFLLTAVSFASSRAALAGKGGSALAIGYVAATLSSVMLSLLLLFIARDRPHSPAEAWNLLIGRSQDGSQVMLDADFWVSHLTFLPVVLLTATVGVSVLAKVAGRLSTRPLLASGVVCATMGLIFWGLASV
jgi:hypothetical protein